MRPFQSLKEAVTRPEVLRYVDDCLTHRGVRESDVEDHRQDIVTRILLLETDRPLNSEIDKWKGYFSKVVERHVIDARRACDIEPSGSSVDTDDTVVVEFLETPETTLPDGSTLVHRMEHLFRAMLDLCRVDITLLSDDPKGAVDTVTHRRESILDDATVGHLTQEQADKWRAVWRIVRTEWPRPSNREIAARVGLSDKTVAKALDVRDRAYSQFQHRVADQWNKLTDQRRWEWLWNVVALYIRTALAQL